VPHAGIRGGGAPQGASLLRPPRKSLRGREAGGDEPLSYRTKKTMSVASAPLVREALGFQLLHEVLHEDDFSGLGPSAHLAQRATVANGEAEDQVAVLRGLE